MLAAVLRRRTMPVRLLAVTALVLALSPGAAWAHAQLLSTSPADNAVVTHQPRVVSFTFGESVGIDGDAVRVFDAEGRRVDTGATFHPGGSGPTVGVHLRPALPRGTYTATYRVVSADTHIVTGGFVFSVGARSSEGAATLSRLLAGERGGPVGDTAFAVARAVQYTAIGVAAGLFAFLLLIWSPALHRAGLAPSAWQAGSTRYLLRAQTVLEVCCVAGLASALAGIVLQGAEARGIDFWHAVGTSAVRSVLPTRFGIVWGAGFIAWLMALISLMLPARSWSGAGLIPRDATLGATGVVLPRTAARWPLAALGLPLLALLALPALAGHATIQHPIALFAPVNVIHVTAMAAWVGGLTGLLVGALTLPRDDPDPAAATRVLAGALARFSPIALGCVIVLIATGVVQALIEMSAWSQFVDTGYGRALLVKIAALAVLIALGARQRFRTIPAVTAAADAGTLARTPLRLLLQTLGAELVALAVVLGAVGSLAGSAPAREHGATTAAASPGSLNGMSGTGAMRGMAMPSRQGGAAHTATGLGAARLAVSVSPATVGQNTVDLRLTGRSTGHPFVKTKQLTVTATLTSRHIGPLDLSVHRAGPGRYSATGVLGAPGVWTLQITDRTSEFDESQRSIRVPIR